MQAVQEVALPSHEPQSLTWQVTQTPLTKPKPVTQVVQVPVLVQVSQLLTWQLAQTVPLTKKPSLQWAHSFSPLQLKQFSTAQGSQLEDPAVLRLKPASHPLQVSAPPLQLVQWAMMQLKHCARSVDRVNPVLQLWQMLLNSQIAHWVTLQATQVPVLLTENP